MGVDKLPGDEVPSAKPECKPHLHAEGSTGAELERSGQAKPCPDHKLHQDGEAEIS